MKFFSKTCDIILGMNLTDLLDEKIVKGILANFSECQSEGSGWRLGHIKDYTVKLSRFAALGGSSYIPLPKVLADKKALINQKNADQECFKWTVTRALNPVEIRSRKHVIHTESVTKVALSGNDDKHVIIPGDPEGRTWAI